VNAARPYLPLPELHLVGVADPGKPNLERIVIRPTQQLNLNGYGLAVGVSAGAAGASPIFDNCFWFPAIVVQPPSWVLIYTGPGEQRSSDWQGEAVLNLHWQRKFTVFTLEFLVPVLFRVEGAAVGQLLTPPYRLTQ